MAAILLLLAVSPLVVTGIMGETQRETISHHGGYTFDLHLFTHLLTIRNTFTCYFVSTTSTLEKILTDRVNRVQIQDELLKLVHNKQGITKTSLISAELRYKDGDATTNCVGRDLYDLKYPPSDQETK